MRLIARPAFDKAFRKLSAQEQVAVKSALAKLPASIGQPHAHSGVSIRSIGKYLECRAGLQLRLLFAVEAGDVILFSVGNHNDITRFVKNN